MHFIQSVWSFLGQYQTKPIRRIHLIVVLLVILQILLSNGMKVTHTDEIVAGFSAFWTWSHIIIGILLAFLLPIFMFYSFKQHGFRYFYAYLWGDFTQIKQDCQLLIHFKLPESKPAGLATSVQGLGFGAMFLVIVSGLIWFILWTQNAVIAIDFLNAHKALTGLIELYLIGHGAMAVLHFILYEKTQMRSS